MVPIGVVLPKNAEDVAQTLAVCRRHGAPVVARGGGTGIPGQTVNVAVLLDFSKYMNRILELNPAEKYARVQPGIVLDELRKAANQYELTFGPDPATHSRCTLGGMIGNNSCGIHSVMAGETVDNIDELEVITYDGIRMRVGKTSDEEYDRIQSEGGRRADIYKRLRALCDRYADKIRQQFPRIPPAFRATTCRLCFRKTGSMLRERWSDQSARACLCSKQRRGLSTIRQSDPCW